VPDEPSGTWNQLVPELYYDLIGRIPAGVIFWLLVGAWLAPTFTTVPLSIEHFPFGVAFVILLLLSYVIGIVIVPIRLLVHNCYRRWAWKKLCAGYAAELSCLTDRFRSDVRVSDAPPDFVNMSMSETDAFQAFLHEDLKHNNAQARVLLPKMSAEVRLCDNLFTVGVGVGLAHLLTTWTWAQPIWVWCALAIGILALAAAPYRYLRLLQRRIAYAFALGYCDFKKLDGGVTRQNSHATA